MTPDLNAVFDRTFPVGQRDDQADVEDLYGAELTFGEGIGPIQKGWEVKVVAVDVEKGTHQVKLPSGVRRTFKNTDDVYELK